MSGRGRDVPLVLSDAEGAEQQHDWKNIGSLDGEERWQCANCGRIVYFSHINRNPLPSGYCIKTIESKERV